jgi:hypothetical protein
MESESAVMRDHEKAFLSFDILCEILSRVDARTLARASCVSSEFRRVCEGEEIWERRCNVRWPSTRQGAAKALISQTGGFRKFYAQCHPSLSGQFAELSPEDDDPSPANFVSIIDIIYDGQPMLSRIVHGFPGAEDPPPGWFEYCPFQFDLLETPNEINGVRKEEDGITTVAIQTDLSPFTRAEERLWTAVNANMTASWILINKRTGHMANLASCSPVGGLRHWPCEEDFVLHFGTITAATHCSVVVKARFSSTEMGGATAEMGATTGMSVGTSISVTEVGMKLENVEGGRLYGMESIAFLDRALRCRSRTPVHAKVLQSYQDFRVRQAVRKAERVRDENRRELMAALVSGVGAFLCLCYILL